VRKPAGPEVVEAVLAHPILKRLCALAVKLAGINLTVVFPESSGWAQVSPTSSPAVPSFCATIQQSRDGERHCRMCHILMAVAACGNKAATEQICHAGASVLAVPMPAADGGCYAVLSSCTFAGSDAPGKGTRWRAVAARGRTLGLDPAALRKAYSELPLLDEEKVATAREILAAVAEAIDVLMTHAQAQQELDETKRSRSMHAQLREAVASRMRAHLPTGPCNRSPRGGRQGHVPPIVRVVTALVRESPNMPFSVADIAAAARISPNHFSSLFRKHQEQSFSAFLTEQRIELAKQVLGDLTLNIAEVARTVGYDDPAYFARRFRQKVGVTPREWRIRRTA
jgi:AraC-like DNA-binding protein/ligand-binding sensor protein